MADKTSRLTLNRELSRSGIATVWEAYDSGLDRKVLVKSIHPQYARESDLRARFEREARAIARLSHSNVVQIYDLRTEGDEISLVLEFVEGTSLGKLLKDRGALPLEVAVTIAADILAGLEHAHAAGIVHRDLKPDNVLVSQRGEVKITDFGLAMLHDQPAVTQEGMVIGTPSYMAPEQAEGGEVTPVTDLFALGLILYEMLTGRRIHEGSSIGETFQNVLKYKPPDLEASRDVIPENLAPVLKRLLEKSPAKRYGTAGEALRYLLDTQPAGVLPKALIADFLIGEPIRRTVAPVPSRVRSWKKPLGTLSLALILLVGGWLVFHFARITSPLPVVTGPSVHDSTAVTKPSAPPIVNPRDSANVVQTKPAEQPAESAKAVPPPERPVVINVEPSKPQLPPASVPGFLTVTCRPWASVYIGDSLLGQTPLPTPAKLPSGSYDIVLINGEIGHPVVRPVVIKAGETTELKVNLYDYVARFRIASVRPWADVYVNGKLELRTPSSKVIVRPLGTYAITFKNPDFPDHTDTLVFREGDPLREIRVDMTQK